MFSYYGSKNKIIKHYPKPEYDTIIEPFAGAAWYSFNYKDRNILLNEKYEYLYDIWNWLINDSLATQEFIINNSDFYVGQDIRELDLPDNYKKLLGFCIGYGNNVPRNLVQKSMCEDSNNPTWASRTKRILNKIADNINDIKHWQIKFGDYKELPNLEATWFIDPPYKSGGQHYKVNDINYEELAEWCKSRKGQVIVCENNDADWLDFTPLVKIYGQRYFSTETVWMNH